MTGEKTPPVQDRLNPHLLDVAKRESDYVLLYAGAPLRTPKGREVSHPNPRLLEHILREASLDACLDPSIFSAYALYCLQKDALDLGADPVLQDFHRVIARDPIIRRKLAPEETPFISDPEAFVEFLDQHGQTLSFVYGGIAAILADLNRFLHQVTGDEGVGANLNSAADFQQIIQKVYLDLAEAERSAVVFLRRLHQGGLVLPLLLVCWNLTPSEYANALFSLYPPNGRNSRKSVGDGAEKEHLPDWSRPRESFARIRGHAAEVKEFLSYFQGTPATAPSVEELIRQGENDHVEFKSFFRWNIKAGRRDSEIEKACVKSVAAFLNSGGGTLLIGVGDSGKTHDLGEDGFPNEDRFSLHFWNVLRSALGQDITPYVQTAFVSVAGHRIFTVRCTRSPVPVFLRWKGTEEAFYIRIGPSSRSLQIGEALKFISRRFGPEAAAVQI